MPHTGDSELFDYDGSSGSGDDDTGGGGFDTPGEFEDLLNGSESEPEPEPERTVSGGDDDDNGGGGGTTSTTTSPGSDPSTADDPFQAPSGETFDPDTTSPATDDAAGGMNGPDTGNGADEGDTTSRTLRPDAQSDPFDEPTVETGGRPAESDAIGASDRAAQEDRPVTREEFRGNMPAAAEPDEPEPAPQFGQGEGFSGDPFAHQQGVEEKDSGGGGVPTQGIEEGGGEGSATIELTNELGRTFTYTGPASEVARRAEGQFLEENPTFTTEDVRFIQVDEGGRMAEIELTNELGQTFTYRAPVEDVAARAEEEGIDFAIPGSITGELTESGEARVEAIQQERVEQEAESGQGRRAAAERDLVEAFAEEVGLEEEFHVGRLSAAEQGVLPELTHEFGQGEGYSGPPILAGDPVTGMTAGQPEPASDQSDFGPSISSQFLSIFEQPTAAAGAVAAVDFARDLAGQGHEGDTISSEQLAEESGLSFALDLVLGNSEAVKRDVFGLTGATAEDVVDISGPELLSTAGLVTRGPSGELDTEVTDRLTQGEDFVGKETRAVLGRFSRQGREFFGVGEEAEAAARSVGAPDTVAEFAGGLGEVPGELAGAIPLIPVAVDVGVEVASNLPETVQEYGAGRTTEAVVETTGRFTEQEIQTAQENPARYAGQLTGALATGFVAGRAIQRAPDVARGLSTRARGGRIVDFEDVSNPPVMAGKLPGFTAAARADPDVAREEFIRQAESNVLGQRSAGVTVDLVSDAGAGPLRLTPELQSALAGLPEQAAAGVRNRAVRVAETPGRAMERAGAGVTEAVARGEAFVVDLPTRAAAAARQQAMRPVRRVEDLRLGAELQAREAVETVGRIAGTPGRALDRAGEFGFQAGVRTRRTIDQIETSAAAIRSGDIRALAPTIDVGMGGPLLPSVPTLSTDLIPGMQLAGDVGYRAGVRTAETFDRARYATGAPGRALDRAGELGFNVGVRTRQLYESLRAPRRERSRLRDLTLELGYRESERLPVAFHGRGPEAVSEYGGFGSRFEAPEGGSELPGAFFSADLSPLRVSGEGRSGGLSLPRLGLPRPRVRTPRVLAEEGIDVQTMPESAAGFGYSVRVDDDLVASGLGRGSANRIAEELGGERVPDPTTSGYQFLAEEADPGGLYIRPRGSITPEQEAVAPPGSVFEASGAPFGIRVGGFRLPFVDRRVGGEIVPGRMTRRADPLDAGDLDEAAADELLGSGQMADETVDAISSALSRQADPTEPILPLAGTPSGAAGSRSRGRSTPGGRMATSPINTRAITGGMATSPVASVVATDVYGSGISDAIGDSFGGSYGGGGPTLVSDVITPSRGTPNEPFESTPPSSPITPSYPSGAPVTPGDSPIVSLTGLPPRTAAGPRPGSSKGRRGERRRDERFDPWSRLEFRDLINPITGD